MNISSLIISVEETISQLRVHQNITQYTQRANELTVQLTKLYETYSIVCIGDEYYISDELMRINSLIAYLKSCVSILESGRYNRWHGFKNNYNSIEVNRIKVISTEIKDVISVIEKDLLECENSIKKCKTHSRKRAYTL